MLIRVTLWEGKEYILYHQQDTRLDKIGNTVSNSEEVKLLLESTNSIIMQVAIVPAVHGKWEVKEVPTPHPATNQVLIKIYASGLCYTVVHKGLF